MAEKEYSPVYKASRIDSEYVEEVVDRISELPVHVIHQMLSKLHQKQAARTSVLSKKWYYCWTSRPNLVFDLLQHMPLEKFVEFVDQSIQPHLEQNLRIEEFNLKYHDAGGYASSHIDRWIDLAVKHNVRVLKIDTLNNSGSEKPPYRSLPDVIYGAENLTTLMLSKYKFEITSSTSTSFCFLKDLYLSYVHISQSQLQKVLDECPFIANLSLCDCKGISKLHVFGGLVHLKSLFVASCELDNVIVRVSNLTKLTIIQGRELESVEIQAPSLLDFTFSGDKLPSMDPSSLESARLQFNLYRVLVIHNFGDVDSVWCTKLQHFLRKFDYSKGLMFVICQGKNSICLLCSSFVLLDILLSETVSLSGVFYLIYFIGNGLSI
ncbi:F-box/LRR-repeat protein 25-like [Capsicum annuum]